MQALRDSYTAQLPAKIVEIRTLWQRLAAQPNHEDLKTLHRLVHSLTGSGATFGYSDLSTASRVLELCLKEVVEHGKALDGSCQQRVEDYLREIEAVARVGGDKAQDPAPALARVRHDDAENRLIYMVDDDAQQAQDITMQLRHFGYEVQNFERPAVMMEAVSRQTPAAVIMDVMFPEGEFAGIETIAALKRPCAAPPPVVFLSSRDDLPARLAAVRACSDGYFTKPVDAVALIDLLDRLTARRAPEAYRILIVDDDAVLADHYALTLRQADMEVVVVNDPLALMAPLAEFKPDLILIDLYMPGCDGMELAAVLRQQSDYLSIPIVFLSTEVDAGLRMKAMHLGADDFLTKPVLPNYLVASVQSRAQRARALRQYMIRDSLTGLFNHSATNEYFDMEYTRAQRQGGSMAYAMIDLDHFKTINDTQGHPAGDRVLKSLARLLQQRLRKSDILGRIGGEEFALILTDTDGATALAVLDEIRAGFQTIRHHGAAGVFRCSFSCGIAVNRGYSSAADFYQAADKALYRAKHEGRNRVVLV